MAAFLNFLKANILFSKCMFRIRFLMSKNIYFGEQIIKMSFIRQYLVQILLRNGTHGGHLEKWRPFCFFSWLTCFSEKGHSEAHLCQIWCLYHQVKDFSAICSTTCSRSLWTLRPYISCVYKWKPNKLH